MRIMKKVIFALAAVVALVACSKEQTVNVPQGAAIGFDTFVDNATRVDDPSLTNTNLVDFGVFGTVTNADATALIFDNVEVEGSVPAQDGGYTVWSYEGTQYWIAGAKYNFAAVAPYNAYTNASYTVAADDNGVLVGTTTFDFANDGTIDLIYAEATAVGQEGSGDAEHPANRKVGFTFRHILSKIKFSFENQYLATGSTIRVRNVELYNAHKNGTVTLGAETTKWTGWETGAWEGTIDFGDTENTTNDPTATSIVQGAEWESENARFIIPGKLKIYSVNFDVDVLYGDTVIKTYEHVATLEFKPEAGVAYDIKSTISHTNIDPSTSQEPIEFTVTEVEAWDEYEPKNAIIN